MEIIWRGKLLTPEQLEAVLPVLKQHQDNPWTQSLNRHYDCTFCTCQKSCDTQDEWCLKADKDLKRYYKGQEAFAFDMDKALCD